MRRQRAALATLAAGLAALTGVAACSSSSSQASPASPASSASSPPAAAAETNPPGDIPDTQVYVAWTPPGGGFTVKAPEGWSRTTQGQATVFADKFNSVRVEKAAAAAAPTVASVRSTDVPAVRGSSKHFTLRQVTQVHRKGGDAVLAEYQADSAPDQVTGKSVPLDVQRYVFFRNGSKVVLTLSGAVGADNVDPWRIVTDSFRWS
jgi:hypothetical protein